ncbi:MAG: hypothetical protein ACOX9R_14850 [Armatimonadota bacterium]|jgi:hypothetical protein
MELPDVVQTLTIIAMSGLIATAGVLADGQPRELIAVEAAARGADRTWEALQAGADDLESRRLFSAALAYCEADRDLDRLASIFAAAAAMQDRDPDSPGFGNFHWRRSETAVRDFNPVEFAMRDGAPIWLRHRDSLTDTARAELRELLEYAVEACLRHRVPPAYTNITLMNAGNLILLGEALGRPEAVAEGRVRLDTFSVYTWEAGVHEFASPVYYGVDIDALLLLHALTGSAEVRAQAAALLELFLHDVALNWFAPAQRLAGAHSRSNDYLRGRGGVEGHLWMAGWFDEPRLSRLAPAIAAWRPPLGLREIAQGRLPRLVRQSWGIGEAEARTHYLLPGITLSTAGAHFGPDDVPLTVDFAAGRDAVRCYVIPDARQDPFGVDEFALGPHSKALHSRPFFAAAQRTTDAVALAICRDGDLIGDPRALATHFVMPRDVDACLVGDREISLEGAEPFAHAVDSGISVAIVKGGAVAAVRVVWARGFDGAVAPAALVWDGGEHDAMRLTIDHTASAQSPVAEPGAALWVRVGSGVEDVPAWLAEFARAPLTFDASPDRVRVEAAGGDGPVELAVAAPWLGVERIVPEPCRVPLELDGADVGRPILERIPAVAEYVRLRTVRPQVAEVPAAGASIEAERGLVLPPARVQMRPDASGGALVAAGDAGGGVILRTTIEREGGYVVEARIAAPRAGAFTLRLLTESSDPAPETAFDAAQGERFEWVRLTAEPIALPRGRVGLQMVLPPGASVDAVRVRPEG